MKNIKFNLTMSRTFILFLIVVMLYLIIPGSLFPDKATITASYAPGEPFENLRFTPVFNEEEDVLIQPFVATSPYLQSLKVRLTYHGLDAAYDWILNLRLVTPSGKIIREHNLTIGQFSDFGHYVFNIDKILLPHVEYRLEMRQIAFGNQNADNPQSFSVLLLDELQSESKTPTFNGIPIDGSLDIIYTYACLNAGLIVSFLFPLFLIFAYIFFRKSSHSLLVLLAPLATFLMAEQIAGNLTYLDLPAIGSNLFLHYLLFFFILFLIGKHRLSTLLYGAVIMFIALAQYFILEFRGKPISLSDVLSLRTAFAVAESYTYSLSPNTIFCLITWALYVVLMFLQPVRNHKSFSIKNVLFRLTGLIVIVFVCIYGIRAPKNSSRLNLWKPLESFQLNGILYTPYLETEYFYQSTPEGYSIERIDEIVQQIPSSSTAEGITPKNLIVIMNESLADLSCIAPIQSNKPLLPYITELMENTISGWLHMPVFAGNTSTSEYEVLTGNSNLFLVPGVSAYQLNVSPVEYGMATTLKEFGYHRIALHPEQPVNWNRASVYPMMEFEKFYSLKNWGNPGLENLRSYASDASAYRKLIYLTEEKEPNQNLFLFLVTMQNHSSYASRLDYTPQIELQYNASYPKATNYLSLINDSDSAYRELIEYYTTVDEPTMIVLFGDHQPQVENEFYEELFGKPLEALTPLENQKRYMTPYIIWANYPLKHTSDADMSSNYFGSYILQLANIPLRPYDRFLLNLKETLPILGQGVICDAEGTWYSTDNLPEEYQRLIDDYKILQYNRVYDRANQLHYIFTPDTTP